MATSWTGPTFEGRAHGSRAHGSPSGSTLRGPGRAPSNGPGLTAHRPGPGSPSKPSKHESTAHGLTAHRRADGHELDRADLRGPGSRLTGSRLTVGLMATSWTGPTFGLTSTRARLTVQALEAGRAHGSKVQGRAHEHEGTAHRPGPRSWTGSRLDRADVRGLTGAKIDRLTGHEGSPSRAHESRSHGLTRATSPPLEPRI